MSSGAPASNQMRPAATPARPHVVIAARAGEAALLCLAATAWLLVLLARVGWFALAPLALVGVLGSLLLGALAWWRQALFVRLGMVTLVLVGALLYLPPAQNLALSGDSAIYANEGAFLARTGALAGVHPALAALSPAAAALFYMGSDEQFAWDQTVTVYDGIVYRGFYLADAATATIQSSRMPQTIAWHGLLFAVGAGAATFAVSAVFATLGLLLLFAIGIRLYSQHAPLAQARWIALWAALLLAIAYPQIYLARAPLAEMVGAFWTLAGIWCAVLWLQGRQPRHLTLALLMWFTSWSARVDALLLLAPAGLLLAIAAADRDRASLRQVLLATPLLLGMAWLGANPAYVGATFELFSSFLDLLIPGLIALVVGIPLLVWLGWRWGRAALRQWRRIERPALGVVFAGAAFIVLWATLPNPLRDAAVTRPFQEIIWFSSAYVTPLFYWLALAGLGVILWRGLDRVRLFVAGAFLMLAIAYLYNYTSANVYPISLRRLVGDLLPLMALLSGYAFTISLQGARQNWQRAGRVLAPALATTALLGMAWLSTPLLTQREARHELAFVQSLHASLPADGAFIFEAQDDDSWVGWLAAPLFSLYGDWTLLLDNDTPDPASLARAIQDLQHTGRATYIISQSSPLPAALAPAGVAVTPLSSLTWQSTMIGQTRLPYPPPYWEFALPVHIYRLAPH